MQRPVFAVRRMGNGYDRGQVDAFVDRVLATIAGRPLGAPMTRADIRKASFRTVLGDGYAVDEVDLFLERAEQRLPFMPSVTPAIPRASSRAVERPRFRRGRFREGYDIVDVDAFVDRFFAIVEGRPSGPPLTADDVRNVQFTPVRIREGYDVEQVDAFLDQAESWLSGR